MTLGNTGDASFDAPAGESVFDLARFDAQGNPDTSFGALDPAQPGLKTGRVITAFSARAVPAALAILPDDRILAAGSSGYGSVIDLAQYLPNGHLDPSFGVGGKVELDAIPQFHSAKFYLSADFRDRPTCLFRTQF